MDAILSGDQSALFHLGGTTLRRWVGTVDSTPREKARLYAQMLPVRNYFRFELVQRRAQALDEAQFKDALAKFGSDKCIKTGGVR